MEEHKKFLADRLLSEERPITYRLLSRALDVHVNTAKEMLYDFHKYQNGQTPDSVHATYLVYGSKAAPLQADGDVEMASSMPEQDGDSDAVSATTVTLVAEDKLQETLSQYDDVRSVHVYSLSPNPQRDLTLLSEVSQSITTEYPASADGAADARKFGTIVNANVRRRERKGAPIPIPAAAKPVKSEPSKPAPVEKSEPAASQPAKVSTPASTASKPAPAKKAAGGIMQSFAKAASKPKPVKKEEEDTSMALSDDGEAGDDDMPVPAKKSSAADVEAARKARKDREDDLRRMMEEEDEEEEKDEDEEMEEPEPEAEPEAVPEPTKKEDQEPQEIVSSTGDGRKRGKRRVMKKKRILDDQGYMVTIQEAAWESFSEDEAPAKKETPSSTPASSAGKSKKPPAKGSQGSIMSFFGKK